jgi:2-(3-amino-3-carboxypropyl)histidine synthase
MEEDRIATDLGIAADLEAEHTRQDPPPKQPKRRFIGRRAAAEAAAAKVSEGADSTEDAGLVQGNTGTAPLIRSLGTKYK